MPGCALFVVTGPAFVYAVYQYLPLALGEGRLWFAVAAGTLFASGLNSLVLLVFGQVKSREDTIEASRGILADKQPVLVTGRLRAQAPLLTAPLSGTLCAAYFYRMYKVVPGTPSSTELPVYWGYGSIPFLVESVPRPMAVRAATEFTVPMNLLRDHASIVRAQEYVQKTAATVRSPQLFFGGDIARQWMTGLAVDADGMARYDWKHDEQDPSTLRLQEWVVPPDVEVSVYGPWSVERDAIANENPNDTVKLVLGPPSLTIAGLAPTRTSSWIGALIALALGAGVLWFALRIWPDLM